MKKLLLLMLGILLMFSACTTYVDNVENLKIDVVQSKTSLTIDDEGVQDEFFLNVTLLSSTDEVIMYKYTISYNEVNTNISREGNFMILDTTGEPKQFYVSLMNPDAFQYLKTNKMITANVTLYFKTKSDVIITKDVQIPVLYTTSD